MADRPGSSLEHLARSRLPSGRGAQRVMAYVRADRTVGVVWPSSSKALGGPAGFSAVAAFAEALGVLFQALALVLGEAVEAAFGDLVEESVDLHVGERVDRRRWDRAQVAATR